MDIDLTCLRRELELFASPDDDVGGGAMLRVVGTLKQIPQIPNEVFEILTDTAKHSDSAVRWWTLLTFQNLGYGGEVGPAHLEVALLLLCDPSEGVRYEAAMSVGHAVRNVPIATRRICETLASLQEHDERGFAGLAWSLSEMNEDALAELANVIRTGADRARRMAARQILRIFAFDSVSNRAMHDLLNDPVVGAALTAARDL